MIWSIQKTQYIDSRWELEHRSRLRRSMGEGPWRDAGDTLGWGKAPGRAET
jgi:hypothetical protein